MKAYGHERRWMPDHIVVRFACGVVRIDWGWACVRRQDDVLWRHMKSVDTLGGKGGPTRGYIRAKRAKLASSLPNIQITAEGNPVR